MAVEFGLLGEIQAHLDGREMPLGTLRQRAVLAALLTDANQLVSVESIVARVWGEEPPDGVRDTLYGYLSRLRQALTAAPGVDLVRRSGGYVLAVDEQSVDLRRFHDLVDRARSTGDQNEALTLFERALALWRGEAFARLDSPWFNGVRAGLDRQRIEAESDHADLMLLRGRHDELLADLPARAAARPLDERIAGQLMLSLYRRGRPAEALEHYERIRLRLADDLGTDPSPPLQHLYQRILAADPTLAGPQPAPREALSVVPRQLPAPPGLFTARAEELAYLTAAVADGSDTAVGICAIGGSGGIGKTSLVLRWAHTHLDRFTDGQLYADLRGFGPGFGPVSPSTVIRGFLEALGVAPNAIPVDPDTQAALYRSLLAGRRMLIVLDNARDAQQVVPLLPGSPTCTVLVTSRRELAALTATHRARPIALDVLSPDESRELLIGHLGPDRVRAEPAAVSTLVDQCAGLPLALGIVAARAATRPQLPLATLARELRDASARLDALDAGELNVNLRAVFSSSCAALPGAAATVFALLGLVPTDDISLAAVASLIGVPATRAGELLRQLEATYLVHQQAPGRFRMHDLVRLHAAEQATETVDAETREAALRRLVEFYLHTAYAADRLLDPWRPPLTVGCPTPGCAPERMGGVAESMAWFDREHPHLLSAQQVSVTHGWHRQVWQLARTLATFHARRGRKRDQVTVWQAGVAAADSEGDPAVQAMAHRFLGQAIQWLGDIRATVARFQVAIAYAEQAGDLAEKARTCFALGVTWGLEGDHEQSLAHYRLAVGIFRSLGDAVEEARGLNGVGWSLAQLGRYDEARAACEQAVELYRRHEHPDAAADTLHSLGYIDHQTGRHTEALAYYQQARTVYAEVGNTRGEVDCLTSLGELYTSMDRRAEAQQAWQEAVDLLQVQRRTGEAALLRQRMSVLPARQTSRRQDGSSPTTE
ncbi:BTAD domain-containing putative transcriptional regulator [Micromonospora sp. CA-240977]|uniref:AfsR/SARP family transcriptional regulator n=1 Tax=Micromonospora sp. CA-240977 TaxID=3239957 RepID=UPI003D8BD097